ncbi:MAG: DinB family protein [Chloroflexi bacterium]|nr:DinB family protein [Chloroflexota bacterium]
MITPEELVAAFERNLSVIRRQLEGLSHEQCLLQPPFRGNCMNWVLGHLADTRNTACKLLGQPPVLTEAEAARYAHGSEPVLADGPDVLPLARLVEALERGQAGIAAGLKAATPEQLAAKIETRRGPVPLRERLFFLYYHDTYHSGQTELLRQLAGTNDKII